MVRAKERVYTHRLIKRELLSTTGFDDLPDEIVVIILDFALAPTYTFYDSILPQVCSKWTKLVYRHIYNSGFIMRDYDRGMKVHLLPFVDHIDDSIHNIIITRHHCEKLMRKYRCALSPRTFTYFVMKMGMKMNAVAETVVSVVNYIKVKYSKLYRELNEMDKQSCLRLFIFEYVRRITNVTRARVQIIMENFFIDRIDPACLKNQSVSVLNRDTVLHQFAKLVQVALNNTHATLDGYLQNVYIHSNLTLCFRRRIEYMMNNCVL